MSVPRRTILAACAAGMLAGCSTFDDVFLPPADEQGTEVFAQGVAGPALGTGTFEPEGVTPGQPTGTAVGQRVQQLRGDLQRLQSQLSNENGRLQQLRTDARSTAGIYHTLVGDINARLQVGTTPGNPNLVAMWNEAQRELQRVEVQLSDMTGLSNDSASTSSLAAYLLGATRATYGLSGAVDEDHRQLAVLEDEVNQTVVLIDRLMTELTEDIQRTTNYAATERANLTTLSVAVRNGEFLGGSLANRAFGVPPPPFPGGGASLVGRTAPLVVIRFDQPQVQYEQALFSAVNRALERRPNAGFDLVGVAPAGGTPAQVALASGRTQRHAEQVLRSLMSMGLPAERVSLSSTTAPAAQVDEVHVYVR